MPLYWKTKNGTLMYGPKPGLARIPAYHSFFTQKEWKHVFEMSPYCKACNGNGSQGHSNSKKCKKARKWISAFVKDQRLKKKMKEQAHQLQEKIVKLEKSEKRKRDISTRTSPRRKEKNTAKKQRR